MTRDSRISKYQQAQAVLQTASRELAEAERQPVPEDQFQRLLEHSIESKSYAFWARLQYVKSQGVSLALRESLDQKVPGFVNHWIQKNRRGIINAVRFWQTLLGYRKGSRTKTHSRFVSHSFQRSSEGALLCLAIWSHEIIYYSFSITHKSSMSIWLRS